MIRYTLLTLFVVTFCLYALKNWYRGLLGLLFLVAFMERPDMPEAMFGIIGLAPLNILLIFIFCGYMLRDKKVDPGFQVIPRQVKMILVCMIGMLSIGFVRMSADLDQLEEFYGIVGIQNQSSTYYFLNIVITSIKWALPGVLVMLGCNTRMRTQETSMVILLALIILAAQIVKGMGLEVMTDGEALQKRAARIMDRDIGFHRNQISIWMASGFWFTVILALSLQNKLQKVGLLFAGGLLMLALILTGSRGGYFTWVIIGTMIAWVRWKRLMILAPFVVLLAVTLTPALVERSFSGLSPEDLEVYDIGDSRVSDTALQLAAVSAGRTIIWSYAWEHIKEAPLFGHGPYALPRLGVSNDLLQMYDVSIAARHPHNAYIQLILEYGLVGGSLFLWFFILIFIKSYRMIKLSKDQHEQMVGTLGLSWLGGYLVSGFTASTFYPNEGTIFVWCIAGIVINQWGRQGEPKELDHQNSDGSSTPVRNLGSEPK